MDHRFRWLVIDVEPALEEHIPRIDELWVGSGEGNVDPRDLADAVKAGRIHVFRMSGDVVATGGIYPYAEGEFSEIGSSCWLRPYRGLGGAPISVDFRSVLASLYEPGTLVTSELYDTSTASATVLSRQGFEEIYLIPIPMLEHAHDANPLRPVHHWVLPPWRVPHCADRLLKLVQGNPVSNHAFLPHFEFSSAYGFNNRALRVALRRLADGDLSVIGHTSTASTTVEEWIAETYPDRVQTQEMFLANRVRLN